MICYFNIKTMAMKNWGLVIIYAWLLQACSGNVKNDSTADADSTAALKDTLTKPGAHLEKEDAQFAFKAATGGLTEVVLGKLAQQKGANIRVKNFGMMMVKDHTKANNKLMALAKSKNINLPASPAAAGQKMIDELSKKSGKDFDEAYVNDMTNDHKSDIKEFEYASKNCSDPDLKAFAAKTLPVLKNHLDAITIIHDSMK
jgi:putative membrane protein